MGAEVSASAKRAKKQIAPQVRQMSGAQALIASLEAQGVRVIFGYPGAQAIRVYDALYDSKKLTHILARHEQAATHMADGFARATGDPGVVLVTSGPGATNTVTGIATAYMDSSPLVVITCNVSLDTIGTDGFQEADITGITMPVVKHSFLIKHAQDIPRHVREAFHIAATGRPGPVLIDIPSNLLEEQISFEYPRDVCLPSYKPTYKGNKKQIRQAARLIAAASRPVFYVGGGVVSSSAGLGAEGAKGAAAGAEGAEVGGAADAEGVVGNSEGAAGNKIGAGAAAVLAQISTSLQIPCVYTLMGKGALSDASPLCAGFVGMHGATYANLALTRADLIIACGVRFDARVTGNIEKFAPDAKIIHIDIDPAEIDKIKKADVPIVGDARCVLQALAEKLDLCNSVPNTKAWLDQIETWKREYPLENGYSCLDKEAHAGPVILSERSESKDLPATTNRSQVKQKSSVQSSADTSSLTPELAISELSAQLDPQNSVVVTEVGQHQMWAAQLIKRTRPRTFISSAGLGTMGFGLPAAIGAAFALESKQIVCIAGDGSLQMNIQEAATAAANGVAVKVLLINNNCLGMVHQFQQLFYNERYSQTELTYNPDFMALAGAYGWQHARVTSPERISAAIAEMLEARGPYLLEVVVSREYNVYPMVPPAAALDSTCTFCEEQFA